MSLQHEAVVWSWDPGCASPLGFVAQDGEEFERRMAAVSEGYCPNRHPSAKLDRGWRNRAPIGTHEIEWARCGCLALWCITYEAVEEIGDTFSRP